MEHSRRFLIRLNLISLRNHLQNAVICTKNIKKKQKRTSELSHLQPWARLIQYMLVVLIFHLISQIFFRSAPKTTELKGNQNS